MSNWNKRNKCVTCGETKGARVQCSKCNTIGCGKCVGVSSLAACKVCKKSGKKNKI